MLLGLFGAVAVVDLIAELVAADAVALAARFALMPLLAGYLLVTTPRRDRLIGVITAALLFSWLGDTVGQQVLVKIGFFLCAQACYIVAFWPTRRRSILVRPVQLGVFLAAIGGLLAIVASGAGPLAVPVLVYGASLAVMAVLATGVSRLAAVGAALFLLSDIVLAVDLFIDPGRIPAAGFVNMAIYLPAQLALVLGVLQHQLNAAPPAAVGERQLDASL